MKKGLYAKTEIVIGYCMNCTWKYCFLNLQMLLVFMLLLCSTWNRHCKSCTFFNSKTSYQRLGSFLPRFGISMELAPLFMTTSLHACNFACNWAKRYRDQFLAKMLYNCTYSLCPKSYAGSRTWLSLLKKSIN